MEVACVRTKREASALLDAVKLNEIAFEPSLSSLSWPIKHHRALLEYRPRYFGDSYLYVARALNFKRASNPCPSQLNAAAVVTSNFP